MKIKDRKVLGVCLDVLEYEKLSFEQLSRKWRQSDLRFLLKSQKCYLISSYCRVDARKLFKDI